MKILTKQLSIAVLLCALSTHQARPASTLAENLAIGSAATFAVGMTVWMAADLGITAVNSIKKKAIRKNDKHWRKRVNQDEKRASFRRVLGGNQTELLKWTEQLQGIEDTNKKTIAILLEKDSALQQQKLITHLEKQHVNHDNPYTQAILDLKKQIEVLISAISDMKNSQNELEQFLFAKSSGLDDRFTCHEMTSLAQTTLREHYPALIKRAHKLKKALEKVHRKILALEGYKAERAKIAYVSIVQ